MEATLIGADGAVCEMGKTCGNFRISQRHYNVLCDLGVEIHAGRQPLVFDGGFVGMNDQHGSEVISNAEPQTRNRSTAGSGKRRRTRARPRSSREAESFSSGETHGAEFRILAYHYETLGFEDRNGLWVAVNAEPLGSGGPLAHLLVALPLDRAISPRAWAFRRVGPSAELYPLKHTNFPDASICAFTKSSNAWKVEDGLLALIDHYSLWAAKSLHRAIVGWWPGPQVGVGALYRRKEFLPNELCGCESGAQYWLCHQSADSRVQEDKARAEFMRLFQVEYEDRAAPHSVMEAAISRWTVMPDMASVFILRPARDEPPIPLLS